MTTIAISPSKEVFTIVAESQFSEGDAVFSHTGKKIISEGNYIFTYAGDVLSRTWVQTVLKSLHPTADLEVLQEALLEYKNKMGTFSDKISADVMLFKLNDHNQITNIYELSFPSTLITEYLPQELTSPFFYGSGSDLAKGAYKALSKHSTLTNKEALIEAVKLTAELDVWSNKNIEAKTIEVSP